MLRYSVSYYEKVAGYWMRLRKGEESFKTRKEAEEFIDVLKSCPEISDSELLPPKRGSFLFHRNNLH